MKTILVTILIFISITVFAQTTELEYNYMTKGYKIQQQAGLDMKRGYKFINKYFWDGQGYYKYYSFVFMDLIREKDNSFAGTLLVAKSGISGKTYYLCIPIFNYELNEKFQEALLTFDKRMSKAFFMASSERMALHSHYLIDKYKAYDVDFPKDNSDDFHDEH